MTTGSSATIPAHTVLGLRAQNERLGFQEFHLVLVNTDGVGKSFPITDTSLKIGKSPDNDVVIDSPTVSRNHLVIQRQGDRFLVQDLQSTNGTFIDGAQIREAYLKPGQLLELGDVQLRFQSTLTPVRIAPSVEDRLGELVGKSVPMRQIFALLKRIAPPTRRCSWSARPAAARAPRPRPSTSCRPAREGPLVVFDCAAVSDSLIESELFGHEKGAFTGAVNQRIGCLERAHGGTLFIDEIDDLALDLQPKLLRALEDREFRRLGASSAPIKFDTRVVAASQEGPLGRDPGRPLPRGPLLPPLGVHRQPAAAARPQGRHPAAGRRLRRRAASGTGCRPRCASSSWPTPGRATCASCANALERAQHMVDIPELSSELAAPRVRQRTSRPAETSSRRTTADRSRSARTSWSAQFEREYLTRLLARSKGNIAKAARDAELDRKHLYSLLHKYGLVQSDSE